MTKYERVIGIDVASEKLDISDSMGKLPAKVNNAAKGIQQLIKRIEEPEKTLVVCESSGGYENVMVNLLHEAKVNVAVVNPRQTHYYAKAHGYLEKTDTIDAKVIRLFGEQVEVHLTKPLTECEKQLRALTRRRVQVLEMINQEKNRLRFEDNAVKEYVEESLETLKKQLKTLNKGERSTKYILPAVLDSMGLFRFTQESSYGWCKSGRSRGKGSVLARAY